MIAIHLPIAHNVLYRSTTIKFLKLSYLPYFLVACLVATIFANQTAIARQLNAWQLLPRSQRLSELYFANDTLLPSTVKMNATQKVAFVIGNGEDRTTSYHYKIVAIADGESSEHLLNEGVVSLPNKQFQTISSVITIPPISSRIEMKIELEYAGIAFGDSTLSSERQSIHYWTNVTGLHS